MAFWIPRTFEELESTVSSGSVTESHHLDFKAFTESGALPKTTAKCVASLAVDGGVLVLGVGEDKTAQRFVLQPTELVGVRDAVDATIANKVSPGLRVTVEALDRGDGTGYVMVVVPESPSAPHMVEDRYYGRSATAAQPLSDPEVRRLWSRHAERRARRSDLLAAEVAREPMPVDLRRGARLFVLAQPVSADPRLLLSACDGKDLRRWLGQAGGLPVFARHREYNPHLGASGELQRRARGVARSSHHLDSDRTPAENLRSPEDVVDLEIWEDGGIRLYYGRASDSLRDIEYLLLSAIAGEVSGVIELAREISAKSAFRGAWSFGVALRGMKSLPAYSPAISGEPHWKYSEDDYDETVEVDYPTLMDAGSPVLEDLVGRLLRATFSQTDVTPLDVFPR